MNKTEAMNRTRKDLEARISQRNLFLDHNAQGYRICTHNGERDISPRLALREAHLFLDGMDAQGDLAREALATQATIIEASQQAEALNIRNFEIVRQNHPALFGRLSRAKCAHPNPDDSFDTELREAAALLASTDPLALSADTEEGAAMREKVEIVVGDVEYHTSIALSLEDEDDAPTRRVAPDDDLVLGDLGDVITLAQRGVGNGTEADLNLFLIRALRLGRLSDEVFLEYLELTQGDVQEAISAAQFRKADRSI